MSASTEKVAEMFMLVGSSFQGAIESFNADIYRAMNGVSQSESTPDTH